MAIANDPCRTWMCRCAETHLRARAPRKRVIHAICGLQHCEALGAPCAPPATIMRAAYFAFCSLSPLLAACEQPAVHVPLPGTCPQGCVPIATGGASPKGIALDADHVYW